MRSVSLGGREWTKLEFLVRREAKELLAESIEFVVEIFSDPVVGDEEKTPFFTGVGYWRQRGTLNRLRNV